MRSALFMTSALAAVVLATPLEKRAVVTETVYDIDIETVVITKTHGIDDVPTAAAVPQQKNVDNTDASPFGNRVNNKEGGNYGWGNRESSQQAPSPTPSPSPVVVVTETPSPEPEVTPAASSSGSTGGSTASNSGVDQEYIDSVIHHHNLHRANHSAPDISWSDSLYSSALELAQTCVYQHNTKLQGGNYGQNIAGATPGYNISFVISEMFYNSEESDYAAAGNYNNPNVDMGNFEAWGHFTQIVWIATTQVACATHNCANGLTNVGTGEHDFTVCNYKTSGNVLGAFQANVKTPLGHPTASWSS